MYLSYPKVTLRLLPRQHLTRVNPQRSCDSGPPGWRRPCPARWTRRPGRYRRGA